jgi:hypothetical protein
VWGRGGRQAAQPARTKAPRVPRDILQGKEVVSVSLPSFCRSLTLPKSPRDFVAGNGGAARHPATRLLSEVAIKRGTRPAALKFLAAPLLRLYV